LITLKSETRTTVISLCRVPKVLILRESKFWKSNAVLAQRLCSRSVVNSSNYSRTTTVRQERLCKFAVRRMISSAGATKYNNNHKKMKMISKSTLPNFKEPTNLKTPS